jgi:hypothetical protein
MLPAMRRLLECAHRSVLQKRSRVAGAPHSKFYGRCCTLACSLRGKIVLSFLGAGNHSE